MRVPPKASEKKTLRFELPISELAFWNADMKYGVEPSEFNLWVAGDSQSGSAVSFKFVCRLR